MQHAYHWQCHLCPPQPSFQHAKELAAQMLALGLGVLLAGHAPLEGRGSVML